MVKYLSKCFWGTGGIPAGHLLIDIDLLEMGLVRGARDQSTGSGLHSVLKVTRFWTAAMVGTMFPGVVCVLQVPVKIHMCRCCRTDVGQWGKVFPSEERVRAAVLLKALCTFYISALQLRGHVHCAFSLGVAWF